MQLEVIEAIRSFELQMKKLYDKKILVGRKL